MEELKITKEKVLEAASKFYDAKNILKTLFPEVFKDEINVHRMLEVRDIQVRGAGEYKDKAFYLNSVYNWEVIEDSSGQPCLIPTRK